MAEVFKAGAYLSIGGRTSQIQKNGRAMMTETVSTDYENICKVHAFVRSAPVR